jgi:hypothetical protein
MSKKTYTMSIKAFLESHYEWEVVMQKEDDPVFSFVLPPVPRHRIDPGRFIEPFAMREQFFGIKTAEDVLTFFQEYGPYQLATPLDTTAVSVTLSSVLWHRDFYLDALLRPIESGKVYSGESVGVGLMDMYLWQNLQMELTIRQPMQALVPCKDVQDALRASIFLDWQRAMPWRRCMREDCGMPFEVPSRRAKIYCSQECAHLQSVRFYNKRQQAAKPAKKKGKG